MVIHTRLTRHAVLFIPGYTLLVSGLRPRTGSHSVPVVLEAKCDEAEPDANEDDEEHAADVVDADAIALVLDLLTFRPLVVPPERLQVLQHTLVQQLQDPVWKDDICTSVSSSVDIDINTQSVFSLVFTLMFENQLLR